MIATDDAGLLREIASFGAELLAKPIAMDSADRRERLARLRERYDATAASTGHRSVFCRFAPVLLQAIGLSLGARKINDERIAGRWDRLVGMLIADVREDAAALLVKAREE